MEIEALRLHRVSPQVKVAISFISKNPNLSIEMQNLAEIILVRNEHNFHRIYR